MLARSPRALPALVEPVLDAAGAASTGFLCPRGQEDDSQYVAKPQQRQGAGSFSYQVDPPYPRLQLSSPGDATPHGLSP